MAAAAVEVEKKGVGRWRRVDGIIIKKGRGGRTRKIIYPAQRVRCYIYKSEIILKRRMSKKQNEIIICQAK
jgi:hypothetical protein